jgi:branched-chain amino acid transport system permease protein
MAIFGGIGQLYGHILGAGVLTILAEVLLTEFPYYYMLLFGLILLAVILFLPHGLVGLIEKWWKGGLAGKHANT